MRLTATANLSTGLSGSRVNRSASPTRHSLMIRCLEDPSEFRKVTPAILVKKDRGSGLSSGASGALGLDALIASFPRAKRYSTFTSIQVTAWADGSVW